jgi:phage-related protein
MKPVCFLGDSLEQLREFPVAPRRAIGFQIERLQRGRDPDDWKPIKTVGSGVREIRVRHVSGAYRLIYIASRPDYVYVLHAFRKTTRATAAMDLELARTRFKSLSGRSRT